MTATFGKLDNARLEPGPGLTVIHAPNEGGKSTWAAFWKVMLYGIDTRGRDKKGYLADKNRYQPWSGAPMAGEMTVEWRGRDITIRRGPRGSVPFGSFAAVYTGTEEPVPGLTASNCGELLTGAGLDVFSRSAFLGGDLSVTTTPELERRIAALVSSGEEGASFTQVQARLKEWQNKRKVNKSVGELPRLEAQLAQVRASLADLEAVNAQIAALEEERARLAAQRAELQAAEEVHRRIAKGELDRRYGLAHRELEAAQEQLAALEQEGARYGALPDRELLKRAQGELQYLKVLDEEIRAGDDALSEAEETYVQAQIAAQDDRFTGLTGTEAVRRAEEDLRAYEQARLEEGAAKKRARLFQLAGSLIIAATMLIQLAAGFPRSFRIPGLALIAAAAVLMAISWRAGRQKKRAAQTATQLLARYETKYPDNILKSARDYAERYAQADQAAQRSKSVRGALSDREARRENGWADVLDFVHTFAPEVQNAFGCSAALSRALSLESDLASARDRVEERRRRLDDLAAQGGQLAGPLDLLPTPPRTPEETAAALASVQSRLEQVCAQLNQSQGRQRAIGDPAALAARQEELEQAHARRTLEYDALALALDTMREANARLQERFSPELNELAGSYMARLTGDKYPSVSLTRELEGAVRCEGDVLPRSALYLSRGTTDQLYLAVRLAVCRLCLPDRPPILLDDALAAFDDRRLDLALDLLRELAREQQILLFSCHSREAVRLSGASDVTQLSL